ncbi:MAG: cell division protein FtsQ/DivIB [Acidobacteriota bacterium]
MDRSRRQGAKENAPPPPAASRLTLKSRRNRRRPAETSLWSRVPKPAQLADACGRMLRRSLPAVIGGAVLAAVGGAAWGGYYWVTHSPRFAIAEISVQGTHHLTPDQLRASLPAHVGDNVFATNLGSLERALRANPWIADAEVHRVLPHTIAIDVKEHTAVALAELGELYLVDDAGRPFKRAAIEADEGAGLPVITGLDRAGYLADPAATSAQIRGALAALASWRDGADRPSIGELHLDARGRLALYTYERGTAIELGAIDAGLAARMQTFDAAWAELADGERARARAIHLDANSDHVIVAFKDQ